MKQAAPIGHMAISASAGSGKTYQLAHRYIRLLALGVPPDRIAAFTFSRKAAGEIFDSIVKYLSEAAASSEAAQGTAAQINVPFTSADFLRLLRLLLDYLQRLQIGTLDSFTVGVVRAFPMELGIATEFDVLDTDGPVAAALRSEVLAYIFQPRLVDESAQREFLEAFKQATFGQEEKNLERLLAAFLKDHHDSFRILPKAEAWGDDSVIWPDGATWLQPPKDMLAATTRLCDVVEQSDWPEKVRTRWRDFLDAVSTYTAHSEWAKPLGYLFPRLAAEADALLDGAVTLRLERTDCAFKGKPAADLLAVFRHVMSTDLCAAIEKTRGLHRVLALFDSYYDERVRRRGRLTFSDCQYLLAGNNPLNGGALLSRDDGGLKRLYIDYRLDAQLDHWLLDEFQDTSDLQWEVLANLADEILQDTTGQRSLFYVGDVKQAIYGWRGGNARLFGRILDRYGPVIERMDLATSYRSSAPVIETVNRTFEELPASLPAAAVTTWQGIWQTHTCSGNVPPVGYAAFVEPDCQGGELKPKQEDRHAVVAAYLNELRPLDAGCSVAVLVRSNEQGAATVNALRRLCPDMNIAHEGQARIRDNPVVETLLALVRFAFHPGDLFAWRLLQMGPLWKRIEKEGGDPSTLSRRVLRAVHERGFHGLLKEWGAALEKAHPLDAFGRKRLNDLLEAASAFDQMNVVDGHAFLDQVQEHQVREAASERAVRVMTIHQAKGLEFDVVFLPELAGSRALDRRPIERLHLAHDKLTGLPDWALVMPRGDVADADTVLARERAERQVDGCFEELCVLYVAMTRTKRALYMIGSYAGKSASAMTAAGLLKERLSGVAVNQVAGSPSRVGEVDILMLYEHGDPEWMRDVKKSAAPAAAAQPEEKPSWPASREARLKRVAPSKHESTVRNAASLFAADAGAGMKLGLLVHALFEQVGWMEETDVDAIVEAAVQVGEAKWVDLAARVFHKALASAEVRAALARPVGDVELWRERSFEVVLGERWISGTFDRVVLVRDAQGRVSYATIQDYKTNRVEDETALRETVDHYRPQMQLYREVLGHILGLKPARIRAQLLFTNVGQVVEVG